MSDSSQKEKKLETCTLEGFYIDANNKKHVIKMSRDCYRGNSFIVNLPLRDSYVYDENGKIQTKNDQQLNRQARFECPGEISNDIMDIKCSMSDDAKSDSPFKGIDACYVWLIIGILAGAAFSGMIVLFYQ